MSRHKLKILGALYLQFALFSPNALSSQQGDAIPTTAHEEGDNSVGESLVWGEWPPLPWDNATVADPSWAEVLNRPIDISRSGAAGTAYRYHIRRTNLSVDREGVILNRVVTEGEYRRTIVREVSPGSWAETFTWSWFASGMAQGADSYPTPVRIPSAQALSYDLVPGESDYVNPPGDFARLGNELQALFFKILAVDATSFDALLTTLRDQLGDSVHIGNVARAEPRSESFELTSSDEEEKPTYYQLGEMRISVAGLSRFAGEPTALIRFSVEGSSVTQNVETPQITMHSEGTEFFRGQMAVSLVDGRIVSASLWGPVPSRMSLGIGGQPLAEQPTSAIIQQVTLQELSR